jgi:hypothetical protein
VWPNSFGLLGLQSAIVSQLGSEDAATIMVSPPARRGKQSLLLMLPAAAFASSLLLFPKPKQEICECLLPKSDHERLPLLEVRASLVFPPPPPHSPVPVPASLLQYLRDGACERAHCRCWALLAGYCGIVRDASEHIVRIELHTSCKTLSVKPAQVKVLLLILLVGG